MEIVNCFNGAAFFQSGKRHRVTRSLAGVTPASMEPLFFKAENSPLPQSKLALVRALQWSRFFSKRKTVIGLPEPEPGKV